jgi:arylsulfatase A-like enzyme
VDDPNILLILTDEERYQPEYERDQLAEFRQSRLPARSGLERNGLQLHRHYTAATACAPSRATLFTGQYPSLHGVRSTDGLGKSANGPGMHWLGVGGVPTMGHWFRAAGYRTFYRGKWHVSQADLSDPSSGKTLMTNDVEGRVLDDAMDAYRRADALEPFGFSGWLGPEPHGADPANAATVRDPLFADQIVDVFDSLGHEADSAQPWLAVASFLNPHDIAFTGEPWRMFGFPPIPDWVPEVPEAPSQSDSLEERPACQAGFRDLWPKVVFPAAVDGEYRRLYHYLQAMVDASIGRILEALDRNGLAENTIVVFTSDHGDQLGAHGGLMQKWHNAYDESIRVPFVVSGPGLSISPESSAIPTSHIDLLPTLLGLAGTSAEVLRDDVAAHHSETRPLPGRDLSPALRGDVDLAETAAPVYFMTEDEVTRGDIHTGQLTGEHFDPVATPDCVESVIAAVDGSLWKLNRYYDVAAGTGAEEWELHDLTSDPGERENRYLEPKTPRAELERLLAEEREKKRLTPTGPH